MQYRDLIDPKVSEASTEVRLGRKWSVSKEIKVAEECLQQKGKKSLVSAIAKGRAGLCFVPRSQILKGKDRHYHIQEEIRTGVEEKRMTKMVGIRQQGA